MSNTPTPQETWQTKFIEEGAAIEHTRWANWQKHFFGKCLIANSHNDTDFVNLVLKKEDYERWCRQIETPYADLSEREKESDRREVRSYLPLVTTALQSSHTALVEKVQGKREVITGKSGSEYEKWQRYRNETLDDILKLIQDSV